MACAIAKPARRPAGRPNTLSAGGRRVVVGDATGCDVTVDVLSFTGRRARFSQNCFRFPMPLAQCHCRAQTSRLLRRTLAQFYRIPRERCADRHGVPSSSPLVTTVYYSVLSQSEASRTAETTITIFTIYYTPLSRA